MESSRLLAPSASDPRSRTVPPSALLRALVQTPSQPKLPIPVCQAIRARALSRVSATAVVLFARAVPPSALVRARVQPAVQHDLPVPVGQALRGRVISRFDDQAVVLFELNGLSYVAEPRPATTTEAGGWIITSLRQPSIALGVRRLQDALLVLVGAIELTDPFPDLGPFVCVA